ncbi:AmmeMemoRadiSam system protein B [Candidatus Gottesmanbacteria bacterium]|nr:AmmeMemoRadiSam system protein B [Candidatus Gottesmanbacteria bacterium]MBI5452587.1 AmmeMemoRadiSam system protein B [Candidatus Gottesmanbacteria bacterium]
MKIDYQSVAGTFMPETLDEQDKMVREFLANVPYFSNKEKLKTIIVPHAGYIYSGEVAAYGYKQLIGSGFTKIILVGPSHRVNFSGIIEEICDHSVEVQLPFIRNVLPQAEILPIVYGEIEGSELAKIIEHKADEKSVIIVSSDLSHYYPYKTACLLDDIANKAIPSADLKKVEEEVEACGKTGIMALLHIAQKSSWRGKLFIYKNSGDTAADKSAVVGYGCYGFYNLV